MELFHLPLNSTSRQSSELLLICQIRIAFQYQSYGNDASAAFVNFLVIIHVWHEESNAALEENILIQENISIPLLNSLNHKLSTSYGMRSEGFPKRIDIL